MKIDYGMNIILSTFAPSAYLLAGGKSLGVAVTVFLIALCSMCFMDVGIWWLRKKIHGADAGTDRSPQG